MTRGGRSSRRAFLGKGIVGGVAAAVAARELVIPAWAGPEPEKKGAGVAASAARPAAPGNASPSSESEKLLTPRSDHPQPATYDRLDQAWYQANIRRLQA